MVLDRVKGERAPPVAAPRRPLTRPARQGLWIAGDGGRDGEIKLWVDGWGVALGGDSWLGGRRPGWSTGDPVGGGSEGPNPKLRPRCRSTLISLGVGINPGRYERISLISGSVLENPWSCERIPLTARPVEANPASCERSRILSLMTPPRPHPPIHPSRAKISHPSPVATHPQAPERRPGQGWSRRRHRRSRRVAERLALDAVEHRGTLTRRRAVEALPIGLHLTQRHLAHQRRASGPHPKS